jgi:hypothetical protein
MIYKETYEKNILYLVYKKENSFPERPYDLLFYSNKNERLPKQHLTSEYMDNITWDCNDIDIILCEDNYKYVDVNTLTEKEYDILLMVESADRMDKINRYINRKFR